MRTLIALLIAILSTGANAQVADGRFRLASQLVELMQVRVMFDAYLKQCDEPAGSSFDPKSEFKAAPASFGGISPQSAYWPEVEAIYSRFRVKACAFATADKFSAYFADQIAKETSETDLRAAIAFYSSPTGKRLQATWLKVNASFQKFSAELMGQAYELARDDYLTEIRELIRRYRAEPK